MKNLYVWSIPSSTNRYRRDRDGPLTPHTRGFLDLGRGETLIGDSVAERDGFEPWDDLVKRSVSHHQASTIETGTGHLGYTPEAGFIRLREQTGAACPYPAPKARKWPSTYRIPSALQLSVPFEDRARRARDKALHYRAPIELPLTIVPPLAAGHHFVPAPRQQYSIRCRTGESATHS